MRFSSQPTFASSSVSAQSVSVFSSNVSSASPRTTGNLLHEIFQTDGGARVFRHFGFDVGSRYVSPFRSDATHKNFSVFRDKRGRVYFKDFAAGDEAAGNFLKLLELYGYADFHSQIHFAAALYGFDSASLGKRTLPRPTTETKKYPTAERTSTSENAFRITALETAPFSEEELSVLANLSGGFITHEILQAHGARALRRYDYEGVNRSGSAYNGSKHPHFTLVVPAADGNYYGYCYCKSDTYSTFPNSAKNFHLKFHAYTSDVKFSLGLETLRPNEAAYIVEGVKDFFVARALGLNAFTLGGVQTRLPDEVCSRLAANGNSLAILFDTDFAGISSAKKLAASLNTQHSALNTQHSTLNSCICLLPRLARQETQDAPKPSENDLADYVVRYGYDDELRAALRLPVPLASILLTRGGVTAPARELVITKHCAENPTTISTIEEVIKHTPRLFLSAPTGSGKTFLLLRHVAMNHHKRTGGRTIFVVPTIALAEQIEQEYRDLPLISITGSDTALSLLEARTSSKIIVCTADSLPKILYSKNLDSEKQTTNGLLSEENLLLIVDEAHKLFSDYAYRDAAMRGVMSAIERVGEENATNRVVCISATPNLFLHAAPERLRFDYLHLRTSVQPKRQLAFCPYHCREQEAVNAILREKEYGAVVVRINSESALRTVQTLLQQNGVSTDEIDLITSRRRTTSTEYQSITKESRITRRVILTTSLLDCGVNILNADIRAVLIFDERDPATIVQFASRFRRVENLSIMLFHKHSTKTEQHRLFPLSPVQMFQSNLFQAEMRAIEYNSSPQMRSKNLHSAIGKKSAFRRFDRSMMFDEVRKVWQADVAGIIAGLDEIRRSTLTLTELQGELEDYGVTIVQREELFDGIESPSATMISAEAVAALTEQAKEQAKSDERLIITMLSEAPELFMEALYHTTESRITRRAITTLYPTIQGKPQHRRRSEECSRLLLERTDLFSTTKPDTFGNRYLELRRRLFAHAEAITLLERFTDSRTWARFTEHLAMHQRLELKRLNLHTQTLTPHDRKKLEREWEVRNFVANAATVGFQFQGTTKRHIKFALHRADDLAQRVNAFTDDAFRLTKQRAGELVSALFHVEYKREREVKANGIVGFGGYYAFRHDEQGIKAKTLADFVAECGVDGRDYEERFREVMRQATMKREEVCGETVCAVSLL
ncbi:MAG: DEAD/DEAH box helicase family protein [Candidatus Kapaibacteriota bacterium]